MAEHSNLPAPYESPWRRLGQALRSVVASLGLDARGLWRRNRSGELPRPSWWPRDLVPLFWPLVLAGCLALLLTLRTLVPVAPEPATAPLQAPMPEPTAESSPGSAPEPPPAAAPAPAPQASRDAEPLAPPDPMLQQFAQGEGGNLIVDLEARPDAGLLELVLTADFEQLEPRRQQRLAEAWLDTSLELGFEQLELIDAQDQPRGHRARVGSGMILLDPDRDSS